MTTVTPTALDSPTAEPCGDGVVALPDADLEASIGGHAAVDYVSPPLWACGVWQDDWLGPV